MHLCSTALGISAPVLRTASSCKLRSYGAPLACSRIHQDSLRMIEWDKLCDSVASFARSSLGRDATKAQLWSVSNTFEQSLRLLHETNAAIEMHKTGSFSLDLSPIHLSLVKSAIQNSRWGLPLQPNQALAVASLLQFFQALQLNLKAAVKRDADRFQRFMPVSQMIAELVINNSLVKMIHRVIHEDGSVKDSASPALKHARTQVENLERRLYQLMDSLIRSQKDKGSHLEVIVTNGRLCIQTGPRPLTTFEGVLLLSNSGTGSIVEPISAIPLNDELQQARASVSKAEMDILLMLAEKMQMDLSEIEKILNRSIQLDVAGVCASSSSGCKRLLSGSENMINARATYSLSFGGVCPDLYLPDSLTESCLMEKEPNEASSTKKRWRVYVPKTYHPLLLQQHKNMKKNIKRRVSNNGSVVTALELAPPIPVDFFIPEKTKVLVITGPNTGGKTICLKTVGLVAMMAKSGLYVVSSESARIPWFDHVYADIGDEQSLLQSLSTFSGHLRQISEIKSHSTSRSLVLLDEVGAGTNPLEGAALGMALLESFAGCGAALTMATTHHGELKMLKYSDDIFENACVEFDEENLKPTYKILWGVPGRSNAISIAERLGLPDEVIDNARGLYGASSTEIDEVILHLEKLKQEFQQLLRDSRHYFKLSRELHDRLLLSRKKMLDHSTALTYKKTQEISAAGAAARSTLRREVQQLRASVRQASEQSKPNKRLPAYAAQDELASKDQSFMNKKYSSSAEVVRQKSSGDVIKQSQLKVGSSVYIASLGRRATILRVEPSEEDITVQAGNMKLKLKLADIKFE